MGPDTHGINRRDRRDSKVSFFNWRDRNPRINDVSSWGFILVLYTLRNFKKYACSS